MLFERIETWILLWCILFLVACFVADRCIAVKRLREELREMKRAEQRAWMAAEKARREKRQMAARKEAAVDYTVSRWKEEVAALTREIEKKDRLLNQKWTEARDNVQN